MQEIRFPVRRTIIKGAAWSVPVVALAVAAPAAAASGVNNIDADYHWANAAQAEWSTLSAAKSNNKVQFSTQIAYSSDPWVSPKPEWILTLTVVFSKPMTLSALPSGWTLISPANPSLPASSFVFHAPAKFGGSLTFGAFADSSGPITSTASMSILNGENVSWTTEPTTASELLVD